MKTRGQKKKSCRRCDETPSYKDLRAPRLCNPPALQLSPEGFMWPAINNGCLLGLSELFDEYPDLTRHDLFYILLSAKVIVFLHIDACWG